LGAQRTLRTLGRRFYRIQTSQAFCAQASTFVLIAFSSWIGYPMSTSHVMSMSVVGAGVGVQPRAVRWSAVGDVALAWCFTLPAAALLSAAIVTVLEKLHVVS
jgi:inorganic phosphate transporter, PiT family